MKKILAIITMFLLFITTTFAYAPTSKDEQILQAVYVKIDIIYEKSPEKIEKLYSQLESILPKLTNKPRIYYILNELKNYIESIMQEEEEVIIPPIILNTPGVIYYDPLDKSYLDKGYSCGEKTKYCKYMESCDEVKYYYYQCNAGTFDGDKDGIPCEEICGDRYK